MTEDITSLVTVTEKQVYFLGKKAKAELNFEDLRDLWMSVKKNSRNRTPPHSNGKNAISVEDFAHTLLQFPDVENASVF